jgi:sugar phosphate permease
MSVPGVTSEEACASTAAPAAFRWVVLGVAWAALLMSVIDRIAWSNVSAKAGQDFGLDAIAALSVFSMASHVGFLSAAIFGGLLADWLGPRKMAAAMMVGLGVATIVFGQVGSVAAGLALQFCMGLLGGPAFAVGVKLITNWFPRVGRATAMGVLMTATSLAVTLVNVVLPTWTQLASWRGAFAAIGGITILIGALSSLLVRDAPPSSEPMTPTADSPFATVAPLLRNRNFRRLALANLGGPWGTWGFAIWASTLLVSSKHMTSVDAGAIVASFGVGAVAAKLSIGIVSDLLGGRRRALASSILVAFAAGLIVFGLADVPYPRTFAAILGVLAFGYSPVLNTMIAESAGDKAGSAAGLSLVMTTAGDSLQPLLLGFVYQYTRSFFAVFAVLAAGPLLAALAVARVQDDANNV